MLMQMVKSIIRNEKGQGMVEYGLIVAGVALVAMVGFGLLGGGINTQMTNIVGSL